MANTNDIFSQLQYDIKNGATIDEVKNAYPELGSDTQMISELHFDVSKGATQEQIQEFYPELTKKKEINIPSLLEPVKLTGERVGIIGENIHDFFFDLGGDISKIKRGAFEQEAAGFAPETGGTDKGVLGRSISAVINRESNFAKRKQAQGDIDQTKIEKAFDLLGQGTGMVGDISGEIFIGAIGSPISDSEKDAMKNKAIEMIQSDIGQEAVAAVKKGQEAWQEFESNNPRFGSFLRNFINVALLPLELMGLSAAEKGIITASKKAGDVIEGGIEGAKTGLEKTKTFAEEIGSQMSVKMNDIQEQKIVENLGGKLQNKAYQISTKGNRFTAGDERKFQQATGETPGEFAVNRGMTKVGENAVEEASANYKASLNEADDAFDLIEGEFIYTGKKLGDFDVIDEMADNLVTRLTKQLDPEAAKYQAILDKYRSGKGLTMAEINALKRKYASVEKYTFDQRASNEAKKSTNLQNALREWQFNVADTQGLDNIAEINKTTQGWRMFTDMLSSRIQGQAANRGISLTDWVALSGGDATNLGLFFGKKIGESQFIKETAIKSFGKQIKDPIIKANKNEIIKANIQKKYGINIDLPSNRNNPRVDALVRKEEQLLLPPGVTKDAPRTIITDKGKAVIPQEKRPIISTTPSKGTPAIQAQKKLVEDAIEEIDDANTVEDLKDLRDVIDGLDLLKEKELFKMIDDKIKGIEEINKPIQAKLSDEFPSKLTNAFNVLDRRSNKAIQTKTGDKFTKIEEMIDTDKGAKKFYDEAQEYIVENDLSIGVQELFEQMTDKSNKINKGGFINPELIAKDIAKLGKKLTSIQKDRIAKDIARKLEIPKEQLKKAVKIIKEYINKFGAELKDKLEDLVEDIATKTGTKLKFIDDRGVNSRDMSITTEPAGFGGKTNRIFKVDGGELVITENTANGNSIQKLFVDESKRRQGIASKLLDEAKGKYDYLSAQVSNIESVKLHYKNGFRPFDNKDATLDESIKMFKDSPESMNMFIDDSGKSIDDFASRKPILREGQRPISENGNNTGLVARERFNIPELEKLGTGSDRVVYDLGDGKVLKVSKTARGLEQTAQGSDYLLQDAGIIPEVFESGRNYTVTEKIKQFKNMTKEERVIINDFIKDIDSIKPGFRQRADAGKIHERLEKYGWEDLANYDLDTFGWNDIRKANIGIKNNQPILIDEGTINLTNTIEQYQGVKNLDDVEFREIYQDSKKIKKLLGDIDKNTMYSIGGVMIGGGVLMTILNGGGPSI